MFIENFICYRKAEFALQKVQMQELTEKGMVFDRFAVAYGTKNKTVIFILNEILFDNFKLLVMDLV